MDSSNDSVGIDVPESLLVSKRRSPSMQNDTRIAVDLAKAVFEVAYRSDRSALAAGNACREPVSSTSSPSSAAPLS
jgi:hypothetical protein